MRQSSARITGINLLDTLACEIHGQLIDGDKRCARLLTHRDRVADMVVMAMGQRHMGHAFHRFAQRNARLFEDGIAGEKRIDQDGACASVNSEAGMAEPRNRHRLTP